VASLGIVAIDEEGWGTRWRVALGPPPTEGCLGWDPRIALDFDTRERVRPTGVVKLATIAVYPPNEPVPNFQSKLTADSRLEIVGGTLPSTSDGIGHGQSVGRIKIDVKLPKGRGLVSGETLLIDCSR
jgi:hypothetical protein